MRRTLAIVLSLFLLLSILALAGQPTHSAKALPEYSSQVGEPCSSCHVSPSGGGPRNPRGQAWVGEGKPGSVPDLVAALGLLGVELDVNEADFTVVPESIPQAGPLQVSADAPAPLHEWLSGYQGN